MREFSGTHRSDVLYQGTTLVGPLRAQQNPGFSPCAFFEHFVPETLWQGLKPNSFSVPYGPTKSRALIQNQKHDDHRIGKIRPFRPKRAIGSAAWPAPQGWRY
jgi:hypothetical protein